MAVFRIQNWKTKHLLLLLLTFSQYVSGYKHVIFMHGLLGYASEFTEMRQWLEKAHPNTTTTAIDTYQGVYSMEPMWHQVKYIRKQMSDIMQANPEGVHLLCYSQGGLLCRGILETLPDHNVENFISLSGPQGGQFGDTDVLQKLFPDFVRDDLYLIFYTSYGQEISVPNYWNDPNHQALYQNYSKYLAVINNDTCNPQSIEYRKSFLRIQNLVLIGGPDDGVITPWQSSQFGAYDKNLTVVPMRQQIKWYGEDSFGLRTLDKKGALHDCTMAGIEHHDWHKKESVFQKCILPWLT